MSTYKVLRAVGGSRSQQIAAEFSVVEGEETEFFTTSFPRPRVASTHWIHMPLGAGRRRPQGQATVMFVGDILVRVSIPASVAFRRGHPPQDCPRVLEFVSVLKSAEERYLDEGSASPRDTWFERNHPMGAYYDPRYSEDY
jgi:hypothetical protein